MFYFNYKHNFISLTLKYHGSISQEVVFVDLLTYFDLLDLQA